MKFLVDMPLSLALADWLVAQGHDAVHASNIGMALAPDDAILRLAIDTKRVIVTADLDFPRMLTLLDAEGPGLILFRAGDWSEAETVARLAKALAMIPEDELASSIVVIERSKIRRRRLPVRTSGSN